MGKREMMSDLPPGESTWRKSTASVSGNCVEVAAHGNLVYVRDSKAPEGPALAFTTSEWTAFLRGVHDGEFSLRALESPVR
jgi:hypothetical protein